MSTEYDPQAELEAEHDVTLDTERTPLPESDENGYLGTLQGIKVNQFERRDGSGIGKSLQFAVAIDRESIPRDCGLEVATVYDSMFLDVDSRTGALLSGQNKNIRLGKLLDAVGLRGQKWRYTDLEGRLVRVGVVHKADNEGVVRERVRWFKAP